MEKSRCVGITFPPRSFRGVQCQRNGSLEHDGKMWCQTHHPPTVEAKAKKLHAKWEKEQKQRAEQRRAENIQRDLHDKALAWMRETRPDIVAAWKAELEEKWKL